MDAIALSALGFRVNLISLLSAKSSISNRFVTESLLKDCVAIYFRILQHKLYLCGTLCLWRPPCLTLGGGGIILYTDLCEGRFGHVYNSSDDRDYVQINCM